MSKKQSSRNSQTFRHHDKEHP